MGKMSSLPTKRQASNYCILPSFGDNLPTLFRYNRKNETYLVQEARGYIAGVLHKKPTAVMGRSAVGFFPLLLTV